MSAESKDNNLLNIESKQMLASESVDSGLSNNLTMYLVAESTTFFSKETTPASNKAPPVDPEYKFIEDIMAILQCGSRYNQVKY